MERGSLSVLAPRDERAGGTWLGLNEKGVFAGLTNRFGEMPDPERRSRGEIVFRALEEGSAAAAAEAIGEIGAGQYNPFHFLVADRGEAWVVVGDGEFTTVTRLAPGFAVITERSFGAANNPRKRHVSAKLKELENGGGVGLDELRSILSENSSGTIDAVCVELEGIDYGTRSSTLLRYGGSKTEFWHAEGPPCRVDYEDLSDLAREIL